MLVQPNLGAYVSDTLRRVRHDVYRSFHLAWPSEETDCPDCALDELTQSADNITCLTCDGLGTVLTWATAEVYGRIQHYDFVTLVASGLPPGVEIGDAVIYVSEDVKDIITGYVRASDYGYVFLDSDTYRVFSVAATGVGHQEEWRVELKRAQIDARASGY